MEEKEYQYLEQLRNRIWERGNNDSKFSEAEFNIFKTLGVENKEVIVCRFLGELLKPGGSHGMGTIPLGLFFETVLTPDKPAPEELDKAKVVLEDHIKGDRRVDIVIKNIKARQGVYPIEVKIGAGDQPSQLYDYHNYYFSLNPEMKIYYLTPTGWAPSDESRKNLSLECIEQVSFINHVEKWLGQLKKQIVEQENPNGFLYKLITQFMEVVEDMGEVKIYRGLLELGEDWLNPKIDEDGFKKLKAAFEMLQYSDTLLKDIRRAHLLHRLEKVDGYYYKGCEGDAIDSHALIQIYREKTNTLVAWVCVDTNIYLCCKKKKEGIGEGKNHLQGKDDYFWQYISPGENGIGETFNMKDYSKKLEKEIKIRELLDEVD